MKLFLLAGVILPLVVTSPLAYAKKGPTVPPGPTVEEAQKFMDEVEIKLFALNIDSQRADWVKSTFITDDTETLAAQGNDRASSATMAYAKKATQFDKLKLPPDLDRKFKLLKLNLTLATPFDPKESQELTQLVAQMEGAYGKGKYCPPKDKDGKCLDLAEISRIMTESRDPEQLLDVWKGWHGIAPPMRQSYERFVTLSNKGARELGFTDTGAMWRSKYDMPPNDFTAELDRLWEQVKPLYVSLHAYVRSKLREKYGEIVPEKGPIPAYLLGNLWAQTWQNIYPLVSPEDADRGYDLSKILRDRKTDPLEMVRTGERFFTSLGFEPLPPTFWQRSLFKKPTDHEVVCHASAWDIDSVDDLRIKMCIEPTEEDFTVIHHELGHNFYQRAYKAQPFFFRDGANDGFHEAIGDTMALSITPEYLVKIGLLEKPTDPSRDIGLLMNVALQKIAFLPFGLLIDQWRWKVFSGEVTPEKYNQAWWQLKLKYQGVAPGTERTETDFDPGAKYHVPANVPYTRYFLAHILEFQFHRALAKAAGCTGPLHRCSIYDNKEAGKKMKEMLELGASKPWQEALEKITGSPKMDATAILEYFAPLQKWLDEQNKGKPIGW